jgi:isopenicillin-N N-acyltransferase-like protein
MTTAPAIEMLTVGEDALERGRAHGEQFAAQVHSNLNTYLQRFSSSGLNHDEAMKEAQRWWDSMSGQDPEYVQEMQGIAQGSGRSTQEIALLNARYEIAFQLFGKDAGVSSTPAVVEEADGCTTFGLLPEMTANGHVWLGQNWDWLAGVHGQNLVLRIIRQNKPSLICLTEAGIVGGKMGLNEHGLGLVENGLASSHDGRNPYAAPFHMRCRQVLDARRFDQALLPIVSTRRTCSANFVVASHEGEIIDFETSPDHHQMIFPDQGVVTHSNHFVTPGHGESQMEKISPSTLFRAQRMRQLLRRHGTALNMDHMSAAMSDHFSHPHALCRHPDPTQAPAKQTMTTAAVLMDLTDRVMWVANGPPCSHAFHPYRL